LRNRIRNRILPLLLEENPRALEVLSELARRSSDAAEALTTLAQKWLQAKAQGGKVPRRLPNSSLLSQPRALRIAILEAWLERVAGPGQALSQVLPQLLEGIESAPKSYLLHLKGGFRVTISPQGLSLGRVRAGPNFGHRRRTGAAKKP
jgi:tRNA(Ile)-lysidine synthase